MHAVHVFLREGGKTGKRHVQVVLADQGKVFIFGGWGARREVRQILPNSSSAIYAALILRIASRLIAETRRQVNRGHDQDAFQFLLINGSVLLKI